MSNLNEEIEQTRSGFYNDYNEQTHDTLDDYASSISDDQLLECDRELPFLKLVHEEIIDSYVDYKRFQRLIKKKRKLFLLRKGFFLNKSISISKR
jgi:hypothetical protein